MGQPIHRVVSGDTLWAISKTHLGDPFQWPRIWKYNNRPEVKAFTGSGGIPDPDLIYPGQRFLIPVIPGVPFVERSTQYLPIVDEKPAQKSKQYGQSNAGRRTLMDTAEKTKSPFAFKYQLDDLGTMKAFGPGYIIETKMSGAVVLKTPQTYPAMYATSKPGLEATISNSAAQTFGELIAENKVSYNETENKVTLKNMLVSKSNVPYFPTIAFGTQVSSDSPFPKMRFEIRLPELKGYHNGFIYVASKVTYIIEVTVTGGGGGSNDDRAIEDIVENPHAELAKIIGAGLVVAAGCLIVGTIIEDFLTAGIGIADDPASVALAGGMAHTGRALWTGRAVLPKMLTSTYVRVALILTPVGLANTAAHALPNAIKSR